MTRVLAVFISVLTAVWPLLLPQPVSANPCGTTAMEYSNIDARAGHKIDQSGLTVIDQHGNAGSGGAGGAGGAATGGFAQTTNNPYGGEAVAVNVPIAAGVNLGGNKADASGDTKGGYASGGAAGSLGASLALSAARGGDGNDGSGTGGAGGAQVPIAVGDIMVPLAGDDAGRNTQWGSDSDAKAYGANGGSGTGFVTADGTSDAKSAAFSAAKGGDASANARDSRSASVDNPQSASASNSGNNANANAGSASTTSSNTGGNATGGAGAVGGAGGSTAERFADNSRTAQADPVTQTITVSATGDPCAQTITNATGVLAINGVNDIKNSMIQQATALSGNAANTSVNLGAVPNLLSGYSAHGGGAGSNVNVNPNTNQNTNIIVIGGSGQ